MAAQTTEAQDNNIDPKDLDNKLGSADVSADDERKKFIAQHGENPLAQERAQDVPEPASDELKDLQNEMSEAEHQAKGVHTKDPEQAEDEKEGRLNAAANKEDLDLKTHQANEIERVRNESKASKQK